MAKIKWVFQDEQGENLNRYIATNVTTGEKITFDLLRGGNISVVGTPLNAEKLNELITSINALYDRKIYLHNIQFKGNNGIINFQLINKNSTSLSSSSTLSTINNIKDAIGSLYGYKFNIMCSGGLDNSNDNIVVSSIYLDYGMSLLLNCYSNLSSQTKTLNIENYSWNEIVDKVLTISL